MIIKWNFTLSDARLSVAKYSKPIKALKYFKASVCYMFRYFIFCFGKDCLGFSSFFRHFVGSGRNSLNAEWYWSHILNSQQAFKDTHYNWMDYKSNGSFFGWHSKNNTICQKRVTCPIVSSILITYTISHSHTHTH